MRSSGAHLRQFSLWISLGIFILLAGPVEANICGDHEARRERQSLSKILSNLRTATSPLAIRVKRQQSNLKAFYSRKARGRKVLYIALPSLTLPKAEIKSIEAIEKYEERALWESLRTLENPNVHVIFVSSGRIERAQIELLFEGHPQGKDAMKRLKVISLFDLAKDHLVDKLLKNPEKVEEIREWAREFLGEPMSPTNTVISPFTVTKSEQKLARKLNATLEGADPGLEYLGSKSGNREVFEKAGVDIPFGFREVYTRGEVIDKVFEVWQHNIQRERIYQSINFGTSGQGILYLKTKEVGIFGISDPVVARQRIVEAYESGRGIYLGNKEASLREYMDRFSREGGTVAEGIKVDRIVIDGKEQDRAESGQAQILGRNNYEVVSDHSQVLDGATYKGALFPAAPDVRVKVNEATDRIAKVLSEYGVVGRIAVDYLVETVTLPGGRTEVKVYALEINMRKGGTTHPLEIIKRLSRAQQTREGPLLSMETGELIFYKATDNMVMEGLKGLTTTQIVNKLRAHPLYPEISYNHANSIGVKFWLMGAVRIFGKLGFSAYGRSREEAQKLYDITVQILTDIAIESTNSPPVKRSSVFVEQYFHCA